jgi:hypothetical protein
MSDETTASSAPVETPAQPSAPEPAPQPAQPAGPPDKSAAEYENVGKATPQPQEPKQPKAKPVNTTPGKFGLSPERIQEIAKTVPPREKPEPTKPRALPATQQQPPVAAAPVRLQPLEVIGDYFDNAESDSHEFLGRVYDHLGEERYGKLADAILHSHEDHWRDQLRIARPNYIDQETYAAIPAHLRETASNLSPDVWDQVANSPRETALEILEGARELEELRGQARQREVEKYHETVDRAAWTSRSYLDEIRDESDALHNKALAEWKPTGNEESDAQMRNFVMASVSYAIAMNPNAQKWFAQAHEYLKLAGFYKASGDSAMADIYVKEARELAKDLNREITNLLKAQMKALDPHFADARSWRSRPKEAPQRDTPKGKTTPLAPLPPYKPASRTPGNFALPPARLNQIAQDLKQRKGTR